MDYVGAVPMPGVLMRVGTLGRGVGREGTPVMTEAMVGGMVYNPGHTGLPAAPRSQERVGAPVLP